MIEVWKDKPQSEINQEVSRIARTIKSDNNNLGLLHKDFTWKNPNSPVIALMLKTSNQVRDTRLRQTSFGFWEEQITKVYSGQDLKNQRAKLGQMAFDLSQKFESSLVDVVSFTWRF